jgi:uncharacterized membrane protein YdjX (TVP38/TMEM64 family)
MLVAFGVLIGLLYWSGFLKYFSITHLKFKKEAIAAFITAHYWGSLVIFSAVYIFIVLLMLPITLVLNIAAGYFYGFWVSTLLCIACATIGATLSMLGFRYVVGEWATARYRYQLEKFKQNFKEHGINYLLALQLLPVTPFPIINVSAGLSDISPLTFIWTTALGITPGTVIYTFTGKQFATLATTDSIMSWQLILLLCFFSLLALLPLLTRYYKGRR